MGRIVCLHDIRIDCKLDKHCFLVSKDLFTGFGQLLVDEVIEIGAIPVPLCFRSGRFSGINSLLSFLSVYPS